MGIDLVLDGDGYRWVGARMHVGLRLWLELWLLSPWPRFRREEERQKLGLVVLT